MNNAVYIGLFGYAVEALSWGYLTAKWYTAVVVAFLFAPFHYWILLEWGILPTLTSSMYYFILWTMIGIVAFGLVGHVALGYGFDCEPLLPLPTFGDVIRSPTIAVIQVVAMLLDGLWLALYYHERTVNSLWAIIGAWVLKDIIVLIQYLVTYYATIHQEKIGPLNQRTPFAKITNVGPVFLLYAILVNVPFISLLIFVYLYPLWNMAEVYGTMAGLGADLIIVIIWVMKLNLNVQKN